MLTYLPGHPVPLGRAEPLPENAVVGVMEAREIAASQLSGAGLEIGAYASPFPVPLECVVQYGDMYSYDELIANAYSGQLRHDIVMPSIRTDLDTLRGVEDSSLDFLVACHVIEHTRDPIGVIKRAYSKLRDGGSLVLVIPDKGRTFDRPRELTDLEHLIQDFESPSRERDQMHFREFYSKAENFAVAPEKFDETWRTKWEEDFPIHFHTWTYESFRAMSEWTVKHAAPFKRIWSHPSVADGIEFYFTFVR